MDPPFQMKYAQPSNIFIAVKIAEILSVKFFLQQPVPTHIMLINKSPHKSCQQSKVFLSKMKRASPKKWRGTLIEGDFMNRRRQECKQLKLKLKTTT